MCQRLHQQFFGDKLRITFHVIALFKWLVYLHQFLDLIGSSRLCLLEPLLITSLKCNPGRSLGLRIDSTFRRLRVGDLTFTLSPPRVPLPRAMFLSLCLPLAHAVLIVSRSRRGVGETTARVWVGVFGCGRSAQMAQPSASRVSAED